MATADLITGQDIANAVMQDVGELSTVGMGADYDSEIQRYVRMAYWKVLGHARFPWALSRTPGVITTEAASDVTVLSIAGATVTLSAVIATSKTSFKFYLNANNAVYRVSAHTAGTDTLTLDGTYVQTETGGPAKLYKDEYQTPDDVLKVWDPFEVRGQWWQQIPILDKPIFELQYGKGWSAGPAPYEAAAEVHWDETTGYRQYRFAPWSEDAVSLEFDYAKRHDLTFDGVATTDTPRVPREYRHVIVKLANYHAFLIKDDTKADQAFLHADRILEDMVNIYVTPQQAQWTVKPRFSLNLGLT